MSTLKWKGVPIDELPDVTLLAALRKALAVCGAMWREVARRKLVGLV